MIFSPVSLLTPARPRCRPGREKGDRLAPFKQCPASDQSETFGFAWRSQLLPGDSRDLQIKRDISHFKESYYCMSEGNRPPTGTSGCIHKVSFEACRRV
ncbi:hypothetical protein CSUI_004929 [Cystoisospora suis]|uniref:Uncharacterized protein n=1 Tax=Cystoisospora suis TaxID=483139 RepID=A0A2C6KL62_9APIC|nr:hypothetical protein CSUI_004929 [Cystoisospora suis]